MAIWDYVERRRILARSRTSAGYMGDIEGFTVWKQMKRQGLRVYGGEAPRIIQEVAEIETALALVSAGVGVAILPEGVARRYTRSLVVISLKQERIRSEIGLAFLKLNPPPLARRLIASATTAGLFEPRSRNQ